MFQTFLELNFPFVLTIFFLLLFILTNRNFNNNQNSLFLIVIAILSISVLSDNFEYVKFNYNVPLDSAVDRNILKILHGFSGMLRPLAVVLVIVLFQNNLSRKTRSILYIPGLIGILVHIVGMFAPIVIYFDENNNLHNGPLFLTAAVVSIIYLVAMLYYAYKTFRRKNYMEFSIMLFVFGAIIFGIINKVIYGFYFVLNTANAISLTFIYLYLNVQKFKRDELTDALNRRSFILDSERLDNELKAIISIDLNDLKILNDVHGHEAGDKALRVLAEVVRSCLIRGTELYRTGGDEFEILCGKKTTAIELEKMICDMKLKMEDYPYSFAVGIGYAHEGSTPESVRAEADAQMYIDKARMKGGVKNIR